MSPSHAALKRPKENGQDNLEANAMMMTPVNPTADVPEARDEEHLMAPFEYIRSMPGKQVRSRLSLAFNEWLQIGEDKLSLIMEIVELLHNASLLVDDIEDDSILRRGLPVTHRIYGVPRTINTANYIYFVALEKCMKLGHEATVVFTEQLLELHRGQGKELFWRDTVQCPTEDEYENMVVQKTGGLFLLAVRLMQLFSTNKSDFTPLLKDMAVFFQIRDDYLNLRCEKMHEAKTFAEDLTEGKFSYPIIRAIHAIESDDDQILNILRQRTHDVEVKSYCISVMKDRGAFELTLTRLRELREGIWSKITELGGNSQLEQVMQMLQEDII